MTIFFILLWQTETEDQVSMHLKLCAPKFQDQCRTNVEQNITIMKVQSKTEREENL